MLSQGASGNSNEDQVTQLARIVGANPWIEISSMIETRAKHGRSIVEREVLRLAEAVGIQRRFSLAEVVELLAAIVREPSNIQRLLIAPTHLLEHIPAGQQVRSIPSYLEEILRRAQHEVLLLAPFWDMPTLTDLLRCVPRDRVDVELVLLLVHMDRTMPRIETLVQRIYPAWPMSRIRVYLHMRNQREQADYPHAKCMVVDRSHGYLGSANFTGRGMRGHFEVGVSLGPEDAKTLGGILQHLWSQSRLFSLAWDSAPKMDGRNT